MLTKDTYMPIRDADIRSITLVDIPLVRRLSEKGTVLDSELSLTRDPHGPHTALLSTILLPQRGLHTLVARADKQTVVGQFRLRPDEQNAQIVYIAPHLKEDVEDTAWLHILDAMAREAGKLGAHSLVAEVNEESSLFETMRQVNFAVYARQEIWRREPGDYPVIDPVELTEEDEPDSVGIHSLLCTTMPSLIQQIAAPPGDLQGLVYRKGERIEGYIAVSEGKHGVYLIPYLHPDIISDAPAVIEAAINYTQRAGKVPLYVCVRRYQDWLQGALSQLYFEPLANQAVMVKHLAAGVRNAGFAPVSQVIEAPHSPVPPSSKHSKRPLG
jgi:hypothetical protein